MTNFKKLQKLNTSKSKLIEKLSKEIKKLVRGNQSKLLRKIEPLLDNLTSDTDDKIKFSASNISLQNKIQIEVRKFTTTSKQPFIRKIIKMVEQIFKIDAQIFKLIAKNFTKKAELKAKKLVFKSFGFNLNSGKVIKGSYLDAVVSNTSLATKIGSRISSAVSGGVGVKSFRKDFRNDFPNLSNQNFNTFSRDFIGQVSSANSKVLSDELELNHFIYLGSEVKDSRDFCIKRRNIIYTKEFVESENWNSSTHKGHIPSSDFFLVRGGYNCVDTISFISSEMKDELVSQGYQINTYN